MVLNAYIPSFASRVFDLHTEPPTTDALSTTPTATRTLAPSPNTTPSITNPDAPSLLYNLFCTIETTATTILKEIATTARATLVLLFGFALTALLLYAICATMNLVLTRFGRGDTIERIVARALGQWTAGIKTAWEEGWVAGAGNEWGVRDTGAGAGIRGGNWATTKGEKFALGRQEERVFGGQMVGRKNGEVGIMALAKCEISVGSKKGLEESDMMEGGELVENHWGEKRV